MNSSVSVRQNADLLEAKYAEWCENPQSVEPTWAAFFEGFELGSAQLKRKEEAPVTSGAPATDGATVDLAILRYKTDKVKRPSGGQFKAGATNTGGGPQQ